MAPGANCEANLGLRSPDFAGFVRKALIKRYGTPP
jgi:hypothetical protein